MIFITVFDPYLWLIMSTPEQLKKLKITEDPYEIQSGQSIELMPKKINNPSHYTMNVMTRLSYAFFSQDDYFPIYRIKTLIVRDFSIKFDLDILEFLIYTEDQSIFDTSISASLKNLFFSNQNQFSRKNSFFIR